MSQSLHLTVLAPGEVIYKAHNVRWVQVQLADRGGIGIWPGHAPLLAQTVQAPLRYAVDAGEQALDLAAGILHIDGETVMILTSGLAGESAAEASPAAADDGSQAHGRLARTLLAALRANHNDDA